MNFIAKQILVAVFGIILKTLIEYLNGNGGNGSAV